MHMILPAIATSLMDVIANKHERRKRGKWSINRYSAVDVVTVNFGCRCYERHLLIRRQKTRGID